MNIRQVDDRDRLLAQLSEELDRNETSRYYARLAYVRRGLAGRSAEELARRSGKAKPSIILWVRTFIESGVDALRLRQGRQPKLSAFQLEQIRWDPNHPPADFGYGGGPWTGPLLSEHIMRMHRVALHPRQCQRLLAEFGGMDA